MTFPVPSAAPTSVTPTEVGPLKIHVVWGPVECIHRNGAITGYRVCHTNLNTLSKICSPSSGGTSLDISVSSGGVYGVQVAGINALGEGPFSNEVMIEVAEPGKHQMYQVMSLLKFFAGAEDALPTSSIILCLLRNLGVRKNLVVEF